MKHEAILSDPEVISKLAVRFWPQVAKSEDPGGCWLWTGGQNSYGYGRITIKQPVRLELGTHRISWILHFGIIPDLYAHVNQPTSVLHTCDVRNCVNPAHLWLGSAKENIRDMMKKGRGAHMYRAAQISHAITRARPHCLRGHLLSGENLYTQPKRPTKRGCKACRHLADLKRANSPTRKASQAASNAKHKAEKLWQCAVGNA